MSNNDEVNARAWSLTQEAIEKYISHVEAELRERWNSWKNDLYLNHVHEAIGALLARQVTLVTHFARSPVSWNVHIAPLFLRAMIDVYINFAWILKDPSERSERFVLYGLGQQKLQLEHRRKQLTKEGIEVESDPVVKATEDWINSQRYEFLVDVDVGHWAGLNVRSMAEEADCMDLYNFSYAPFSAGVHSTWPHLCRLNLTVCKNPLHKFHRVPTIDEYPSDIGFLDTAAKYLSKSFAALESVSKVMRLGPICGRGA